MKKSIFIMIGVGIVLVLIASFPRAIEVAAGNYLFGYDQGKHWLGAKSIVVDHKLPLIGDEVGGMGGFFQGAGWYYLLAIPFFLFQGDPYGQLVLMFIIGLSTVFFSYWIFSLRFGKTAGFFIGLLIALSPAIAIQSRFAWPPFVIPFLMVFYVDSLYRVFQGKPRAWFFLFFILGLMTHFETASAGTLGAATLILLILFQKASIRNVCAGVIGGILPLLPLLLFDVRHEFINTKGILRMFTLVSSEGNSMPMTKIISDHIRIFTGNLFGSFPAIPSRTLFIVFCLIATCMLLLDRKVRKELKLFVAGLYIIPCLIFIEFLPYKEMLWGWWLLDLQVLYLVCIGILCSYLFHFRCFGQIFVIVFFTILFRSAIPEDIALWKHDFPDYGGTAKIAGRRDAIETIYKDAQGQPFGVFVFSPPVYTYPYDFLFWWIGTNKYHYVPYNEKRGTFYLLIEPDGEKPWTYKGWLETVIKDGDIVFTKTLSPSGFILEKRVAQ